MSDQSNGILPGINHIIVLMLENRSFDNLLGWLYDPANAPPFDTVPAGQTFDGVSGKDLAIPGPDGTMVPVGSTADTTNPYPDPGEAYEEVYGQLYDQNPPPHGVAPGTVPPDPPQPPPMTGFVRNYALQDGVTQPGAIMNGFRPDALPSFSLLAHSYVTCDRWFASVPSQTLTNRSFVHAGTASGHVNNADGLLPVFINDTDTIYDLLEENGRDWRIYYGGHWFLCNAYLTQAHLTKYMLNNSRRFQPFEALLDDAARGNLPDYAFVEPNFLDSLHYGRENDMHPAAGLANIDDMPSDARFGDELVRRLYQALRSGPHWDNTLLIVTFDEHGGCYDHVPPGPAVPPDDRIIPPGADGYSGFGFDRLGVRVPAVLISPRLPAGVVDHTVYDHTAIIRTVLERFGVAPEQMARLGQRVMNANVINPPLCPPRDDGPVLSMPSVADRSASQDSPLMGMRATMVNAAMRHLLPDGAPSLPAVTTKLGAEQTLIAMANQWMRQRPRG